MWVIISKKKKLKSYVIKQLQSFSFERKLHFEALTCETRFNKQITMFYYNENLLVNNSNCCNFLTSTFIFKAQTVRLCSTMVDKGIRGQI